MDDPTLDPDCFKKQYAWTNLWMANGEWLALLPDYAFEAGIKEAIATCPLEKHSAECAIQMIRERRRQIIDDN